MLGRAIVDINNNLLVEQTDLILGRLLHHFTEVYMAMTPWLWFTILIMLLISTCHKFSGQVDNAVACLHMYFK